jgi:hypothetical protein
MDEVHAFRILDLASGPGEPAATFAKQIPSAWVVSTDFSEAMHKKAKTLAVDIQIWKQKLLTCRTSLNFTMASLTLCCARMDTCSHPTRKKPCKKPSVYSDQEAFLNQLLGTVFLILI